MNALAARKAALKARIEIRRNEFAEAVGRAEELYDRSFRLLRWGILGSAVAAIATRRRRTVRSRSRWSAALRWAPVALQAARLVFL